MNKFEDKLSSEIMIDSNGENYIPPSIEVYILNQKELDKEKNIIRYADKYIDAVRDKLEDKRIQKLENAKSFIFYNTIAGLKIDLGRIWNSIKNLFRK